LRPRPRRTAAAAAAARPEGTAAHALTSDTGGADGDVTITDACWPCDLRQCWPGLAGRETLPFPRRLFSEGGDFSPRKAPPAGVKWKHFFFSSSASIIKGGKAFAAACDLWPTGKLTCQPRPPGRKPAPRATPTRPGGPPVDVASRYRASIWMRFLLPGQLLSCSGYCDFCLSSSLSLEDSRIRNTPERGLREAL